MASQNLWKNIKSVFVVEDETLVKNAQKEAPKKATTPSKPTIPSKNNPVIAESTSGKPGKVTSKFVDVLLGAMEKANMEGFDYLEYKQSLSSLAKMPMDEKTKYQSAFAMAQTMGASPQKLMDSATHYINVLKQEEHKFEKALANQVDGQIGAKKEQIQQLDSVIKEKAEQIKQLTEEITQHQQNIDKLNKEISTSSAKVETTKNNFIASYNKLVAQIHADVGNMKEYLK
jgi:predicted metal-binding transcription factor (methanogenesis marker protein 9)